MNLRKKRQLKAFTYNKPLDFVGTKITMKNLLEHVNYT